MRSAHRWADQSYSIWNVSASPISSWLAVTSTPCFTDTYFKLSAATNEACGNESSNENNSSRVTVCERDLSTAFDPIGDKYDPWLTSCKRKRVSKRIESFVIYYVIWYSPISQRQMATMVLSTEQAFAGAIQLQFSIRIQITSEKRRKKNPIVEINDCNLRVPKKRKSNHAISNFTSNMSNSIDVANAISLIRWFQSNEHAHFSCKTRTRNKNRLRFFSPTLFFFRFCTQRTHNRFLFSLLKFSIVHPECRQ